MKNALKEKTLIWKYLMPYLFLSILSVIKLTIPGTSQSQHEVTVTVKLIQVYVIDEKGEPISDLHRTDFKVLDNGKVMEITEFESHILNLPAFEAKPSKKMRIESFSW